MTKIDHRNTSEVVCPNCGAECSDSWELSGNSGEIDCDCGITYIYERNIIVDYTTYFREAECNHEGSYNFDGYFMCDNCGICRKSTADNSAHVKSESVGDGGK